MGLKQTTNLRIWNYRIDLRTSILITAISLPKRKRPNLLKHSALDGGYLLMASIVLAVIHSCIRLGMHGLVK
jgi:hypothetical protein